MEKIIKLAAKTNAYGLKGRSQFKHALKNKNCGDEIKIEFDLNEQKLMNFRYEGEACVYCQASASLLSKNLSKLTLEKLQELKNQIYDYFSNDKQNQTLVIFDFKHLLKKENNSRKECIALPINAILDTPKIK
jgi:nitrogen fixation NifU-like protein